MNGRHEASYRRLASGGRPHWDVVSNLLAMQARLRGDGELSGHPAGTARSAPGERQGSGADPAAADVLAAVIPLPGAASHPIENPPPALSRGTPSEASRPPEDASVRLDRLEADLAALLERLGPAPEADDSGTVSLEGAIVRLQRAVDRRLGAPS